MTNSTVVTKLAVKKIEDFRWEYNNFRPHSGKNAEIDPLSADSNGPRTDKSLMHIHKVNTSKIVCLGLCIVQTEREQLAAINRIYRQRFLHYMKKWTLNQVKFNQKSVWFYEKNLKTVLKHR